MLTNYDYLVLAFYCVFIGFIGWYFKRLNKLSGDYFIGGYRIAWWMVGGSAFMSQLSAWTFTGASEMAYTYGGVIFTIYLYDVVGYIIAASWFAPRLRQLRVITPMTAVYQRFGRMSEQFYNWFSMLGAVFGGAVWLMGLSIIMAAAFQTPQIPTILACGVTVTIMALYGGRWAVAASDFIQALLILSVTSAAAILTVREIGGIGSLLDQIPKGHLNPFIPLESGSRYDWLYVASGILPIIYFRNNVLNTNRYISTKDGREARKAAFVPLIGYLIFPFIWLIPAFGAHALVPDLLQKYGMFNNPGEAAYIAVAIQLLPTGLLGLLIAGLFATTMSSMDTALVANSALFVKNFYQPILRPRATDRELLRVGQVLTGVFGLIIVCTAIFLVSGFTISLFDIYQVLLGYIGGPLGIPLFLGMFIRRTPPWSGWATVLFGVMVGIFTFNLYDTATVRGLLVPVLGEGNYLYWSAHKFTMTNLLNIPLTSLFFVATRFFYRPADPRDPAAAEVDRFFRNMRTPVDFEKEVGNDNSAVQARLIGRLAVAYAVFIALLLFIPNPAHGRMAILGCALFVGGIGTVLLIYGAARTRRDKGVR